MARNVHKDDVNKIQLPEVALSEDRGLKLCGEPFPVLASISDSSYYKNDRTLVDGKFDSIEVYLEDENGNEEIAPGIAVNYIPQNNPVSGFIIDWRQHTNLVSGVETLKSGCYKVKVYYDIAGITGHYYWGSYRLLSYSARNAEGTSRIFVVLNGYVRETDIDYRDSGAATTFRFRGRFGERQPNYDMEDITEISRVTYMVRNESLNTYTLKSEPLLSCFTDKIDTNHLLVASQIFISDHNVFVHKQYFDQPVILDKEKSPELEYDNMGVYATITAYFKDKVKKREAKYSGDINGSTNAILDLPTGVVAEGCLPATNNIYQSDATTLIESVNIPSGQTVPTNVADSVITVNTAPFANVKATDSLDIPVHDSAGSDVGTVNAGVVDIADTIITLNTNEVTDNVLAEGSKNYNLFDQIGRAVPVQSVAGDDVTLSTKSGSRTYKTGQDVIVVAGDDGATQRGAGVDWYNLSNPNFFGHTKRFTGTTGGYWEESDSTYRDVNGTVTTNALAFPEDIVLDWSQFDIETGEVHGIYRVLNNVDVNYSGNETYINGLSTASWSNFKVPNTNEQGRWAWKSNQGAVNDRALLYEPLISNTTPNAGLGQGAFRYWSCTTHSDGEARYLENNYALCLKSVRSASSNFRSMVIRIFNISEL